MSNGFLSQGNIDCLLKDGNDNKALKKDEFLNDEEKDLLGEIGNISMGSSATALSALINQKVDITTPIVSVTTFNELISTFEDPSIGLEVNYTSGITGGNVFVLKVFDAAMIANLMMGGEGNVDKTKIDLDDMEKSAVTEAMNQMIGIAATSMATMLSKPIDISTPIFKNELSQHTDINKYFEKNGIVCISFRLTIGEYIDSNILQIFTKKTAKNIVSIMLGESVDEVVEEK
ncbi:MAG: flagellar motor switch phosphatase FliY [Clostridiaceae bacterium]